MTVYIGTGGEVVVKVFGNFDRKQVEAVTILQRHVKEVSYTFTGTRNNGIAVAEGQLVIEPSRDDALKLLNSRILGEGMGENAPDVYVRVGYSGINTALKARGYYYKFQLPEFDISSENISITLPIFGPGYTSTFSKSKGFKWEDVTLEHVFNTILANHGFEEVIIKDAKAKTVLQEKINRSQMDGDFGFLRSLCNEKGLDMFPFFGDAKILPALVKNRMFIESYEHQDSGKPVATFHLWGLPDDNKKIFAIDTLSSNLQHTQIPNQMVGVDLKEVNPNKKKESKTDMNASTIAKPMVGDGVYDANNKGKGVKGGIDTPEGEVHGRTYSMPNRDGVSKSELVKNRVEETMNSAFELEIEGPGVGFILPGQLVTCGIAGIRSGIMKPTNYRVHSVTYSSGADRGFRMALKLLKSVGTTSYEDKGVTSNTIAPEQDSGVNIEETII